MNTRLSITIELPADLAERLDVACKADRLCGAQKKNDA